MHQHKETGGNNMALEHLKFITDAENEALKIKNEAATNAKKLISEARRNGEELVSKAIIDANIEALQIIETANGQAAENDVKIQLQTAINSKNLRDAALSKKDTAISFIIERTVNS